MTGAVDVMSLRAGTQATRDSLANANAGLLTLAQNSAGTASAATQRQAVLERVRLLLAQATTESLTSQAEVRALDASADSVATQTQRRLQELTRTLLRNQAALRAGTAARGVVVGEGSAAVAEQQQAFEAAAGAEDLRAQGSEQERALRTRARILEANNLLRQDQLRTDARVSLSQRRTGQQNRDAQDVSRLASLI
jgi:hypothetical protein